MAADREIAEIAELLRSLDAEVQTLAEHTAARETLMIQAALDLAETRFEGELLADELVRFAVAREQGDAGMLQSWAESLAARVRGLHAGATK